MMAIMRVAVVQLASDIDSEANRDLVDRRLGAIDQADLVVLPEATMHDFGSADHRLDRVAEPLDGPFVSVVADHARRLHATVVAGMFEAADDLPFNTLVALGPDGDLVGTYRKIHLYDSFGYRESERLLAGEQPTTIVVQDLTVGLMTCYDLRFPELGRSLVEAGADVFVLPAAWVAGDADQRVLKRRHWRTLVAARAIENTVAVVAAAQGGDRYTGHSMVVDALGAVLAEAGDGADETLRASLDGADIAAARRTNPSLANRRIGGPTR